LREEKIMRCGGEQNDRRIVVDDGMNTRRDAGEVRVKAFGYVDWSPIVGDISERLNELPVASVGDPTLPLSFVDCDRLDGVRQGKMGQENCFRDSGYESLCRHRSKGVCL